MIPITKEDLQFCHDHSRYLIRLLANVRKEKKSGEKINPETQIYKTLLKIHDLNQCFSHPASSLWIPQKQSTGHCKFKNKITHIIVEYQGHSSKTDTTIKPNIQKQLVYQIQTHLNILNNEILKCHTRSEREEPNYDQALKNYHEWKTHLFKK